MDIIYFILRYIPFWAVPLAFIGGEFAYVFWLKSYKQVSMMFASLFGISILFIIYYYWAPGPDGSVQEFIKMIEFFKS